MYVLDNLASQDQFVAATTLDNLQPCTKVNLSVLNAAIKVSEKIQSAGTAPGGEPWQPEYTVAPSERSMIREGLVGIRFRSAVSGSSAQFTCVAYPKGEG